MIVPCIDLMEGKVVQLVQGREKVLEGDSPEEMLRRFAAFPQIQVIDLDAAMGKGANDDLVEMLAAKAVTRVGGGVRTAERARTLLNQGAFRVIVGTAAFGSTGPNQQFLAELVNAIGRDRIILAPRFEARPHRGEGMAGSDQFHRGRSDSSVRALVLRLSLHL